MDTLAPLDALTWPRTTDRLVLRPAGPDDVAAVWAYRRLDEVARWLGGLERDADTFRARFGRADRLAKTLVVEHEGRVVGDLMVEVADAWAQRDVAAGAAGVQAELGWVLALADDPR